MLRNVLYSKNPHTGPKYWVHQFSEPVKQPMPILHNRRSRGDEPCKVEENASEDCHLPTWDWYGGQFDQNWPRATFESGSEISWKNDRRYSLKAWHFRFSQACKELLRKSLTWSLFALRPNKFSPTGKSHNNCNFWQEFSMCWSHNWNTKNDNNDQWEFPGSYLASSVPCSVV